METYNKSQTVSRELKASLLKMTKDRWEYSTDQIRHLLHLSQRAWEAYLDNTISSEADLESRSTNGVLKSPRMGLIPKTVNTLLSIHHNASFADEKNYFDATPLNERAETMKPYYEASLIQRAQSRNHLQKLRMLRLCSILDGTACLYVKHTHEVNDRITYEEEQAPQVGMDGAPVMVPTGSVVETRMKEVVFDGADLEIVPFSDWRADPYARDIDEAYFLRRMWVDCYKAQEMFPSAPKNLFVPYSSALKDEYMEQNKDSFYFAYSKSKDVEKDNLDAKEKCLLTFHYDDFWVNKKLYRNHLCVIVNNIDVVWFGENPYNHGKKPYLITPYMEIPNQLYGVSAVYHLLPSSEIVDAGFKTLYDNAKWTSSPIFIGDFTDPYLSQQKDLKLEGGTVIPVMNKDSLTQLPINLGNVAYLKEVIGLASDTVKEVSGATEMMMGETPDKTHISALDTSVRADNGSSRFQTILDTFNRYVTKPLMQMIYENDRQYKVRDEFVAGAILTPEDIKLSEFSIDTVSATASMLKSRTAQQKFQLLTGTLPQLMQMGVVTPKPQEVQADVGKLLVSFLQDMNILNADQYVTSRDLTPEEIMQQQMMQMMQMQEEADGQQPK